jgi:ribonuclease P protein component
VQEGKRIRATFLEVRAIASPLVHPPATRTRVGLIVPRFRQSAVARNRVKRRLRELLRTKVLPSGLAADLVIRIRPDAYHALFEELGFDIEQILSQLSRWRENVPEPTSEMANRVSGLLPGDT